SVHGRAALRRARARPARAVPAHRAAGRGGESRGTARRVLFSPALPVRDRRVPGGNAGLAGNLTWPLRQLSPRTRTPPRRNRVSGRQFAETSTGTAHSFTASPARTSSFTVFGNPDYFFKSPKGLLRCHQGPMDLAVESRLSVSRGSQRKSAMLEGCRHLR